jgi:hypothetical protein
MGCVGFSLTEAVLSVGGGLVQTARSIDNLAQAVRESKAK